MVIDSGASANALPREVPPDNPLLPSMFTRADKTAAKSRMVMDGENILMHGFMDGYESDTHGEVGDVHRPLCAVSKLVKSGHVVWFDAEENKESGCATKSFERDGIYALPTSVKQCEKESCIPWQA